MSAPSSPVLNVNVACLACDGTLPCAECGAAERTLSAAGHRVIRSSRYATLRAAADGSYGFSACVVPLRSGERSVADSIVALLGDTRVAIAAEDATLLPAQLPPNVVVFARSDFAAGKIPKDWLAGRSTRAETQRSVATARSTRSDATRRLRSVVAVAPSPAPDAIALLEDELAWYRASGIGFSAFSVSLTGAAPERTAEALRESLRASDRIAIIGDRCLAVLPGEPAEKARRVASRAVAAARKRLGISARRGPAFTIASCPQDGDDARGFLDRLQR